MQRIEGAGRGYFPVKGKDERRSRYRLTLCHLHTEVLLNCAFKNSSNFNKSANS